MNALLSTFKVNDSGRQSGNWRPQRFRYWYDHIIDLLLVEPQLTQKQIAEKLGKHAASIGMILNSDLFRARYEQRRGEQSAALTDAINGKLSRVALTSLALVQEKMDKSRTTLPFEELTDVMDSALTRLGYGSKTAAPSVVVNNNTQVVAPISAEDLAASRAKLVANQTRLIESSSEKAGLESKED